MLTMPALIAKNGLRNALQLYVATHLPGVWRRVSGIPLLRKRANRLIIDTMIYSMKPRPATLSTKSTYTSWDSLTDRTYSDRHLPPGLLPESSLPPIETAKQLFARDVCGPRLSDKSTLMFTHFAQWFVDGFLRTDPADPRRNTSTHDIDLSQLYGQDKETTGILRSGQGGRLKSQMIDGMEFPPFLLGPDGNVKPEFENLETIMPPAEDRKAKAVNEVPDDRRQHLFALGVPRGNIHYGFTMMSTLFLREHNRLAGAIAEEHRDDRAWGDDRLFETTRNVLIVVLLKVVIEDYINHITPFWFRLYVDPGFGNNERWYRQNWMSVEFDLLYRWHTLVPDEVAVRGQRHRFADILWDNSYTIHGEGGLEALFAEASAQPAGAIGLANTAEFLLPIEENTIAIGRETQLASYNDYREACSYPRLTSFEQLTSRPDIRVRLEAAYASIDDVELYVGLFAEDMADFAALPTLMGTMVGADAFSQALTNPLLADGIFGEETFSKVGMAAIEQTTRLSDIVRRNAPPGRAPVQVTLTQLSWTHGG
jgi:prostaglandin-endoperoxide synthase 2